MPLKIEIIDPEGPGGQKVCPRPMWVRVTDDESGLMAACMSERSQFRNREVALQMIQWGRVALGLPEDGSQTRPASDGEADKAAEPLSATEPPPPALNMEGGE